MKSVQYQMGLIIHRLRRFLILAKRKVRKEGKPNEIIPDPGMALSIENRSKQAKAPKMMPETKKTEVKITMVK